MRTEGNPLTRRQYVQLAEFRYQLRRFQRVSEEIVKQAGLTPLQYVLLLQIKGYPTREWATIGELAERLQAQHHGVVSLVTRCARQGLVRRVPSPADRRQVQVHLTAKGERYLARLAALHRRELLGLAAQFRLPDLRQGEGDRA